MFWWKNVFYGVYKAKLRCVRGLKDRATSQGRYRRGWSGGGGGHCNCMVDGIKCL